MKFWVFILVQTPTVAVQVVAVVSSVGNVIITYPYAGIVLTV